MSSYREFQEQTRRRRRKRTMQRLLVLLVCAAVILSLAWLVVKIIGPDESEADSRPAESVSASSPAEGEQTGEQQPDESVLAPLPLTENVEAGDQSWNSMGPVEQTINFEVTAPDYRMISLPANGIVDLSYFDTATFLGDSISQSFDAYLPGVLKSRMVASRGASPMTVVNNTAVELVPRSGVMVNMLDTVVESQPDNVYVLMGANFLTNTGNEENFLAYYGKMLDMLKERLDPRVTIYVQAITPVRPEVANVKAGLENNRLRAINNQLAALALEKGCCFLDLQEVFVDAEGNMKVEYAAPDGIHLNKEGTQAWLDYLCSHTLYNKRNPYLYGSPYYIEN